VTNTVVYYAAEIITAVKWFQYRLLISILHRPLPVVIDGLAVEDFEAFEAAEAVETVVAASGLTNAITREYKGKGRPSTVNLLIKKACFEKKVNNIFNMKKSSFKLVCKRKSTVLRLPLQ
jgi:hypothetical protein